MATTALRVSRLCHGKGVAVALMAIGTFKRALTCHRINASARLTYLPLALLLPRLTKGTMSSYLHPTQGNNRRISLLH